MLAEQGNYLHRLIVHAGAIPTDAGRVAACCHDVDPQLAEATDMQRIMAQSGDLPVILTGAFTPLGDQFPVRDLRQVAEKFRHHPMQRNQAFRQYGELLGWELRFLGYSVLDLPAVHRDGRGVFSDDAEENGECLAALWSGLRIEGVALSVELPFKDGEVQWTHVRYVLVSGLPFVHVRHPLAAANVLDELMNRERFTGVAMVSGLGAAGDALAETATGLLDMGWNALLLNDLDDAQTLQLVQELKDTPVVSQSAHADSVGRLRKRFEMLKAVEDRGKGFIALDRDPDYSLKRRVLSHKLGIDDAYAFKERPARWGSMVRFHYRLVIDGELRDESNGEGMRAILGKGSVIPGLEQALSGRRKGEAFSVEIAPEQAYGISDPEKIYHIPRNGLFLAPGQTLQLGAIATIPRAGEVVHGRIIELNHEQVTVDANHELAGKTLNFDISIEDVI